MLFPLGLDTTRLSRWPRASLGIAVLCVLAFLLTECSGGEAEAQRAFEECARYHEDHPYLGVPDALVERFGWNAADAAPIPPERAGSGLRRCGGCSAKQCRSPWLSLPRSPGGSQVTPDGSRHFRCLFKEARAAALYSSGHGS